MKKAIEKFMSAIRVFIESLIAFLENQKEPAPPKVKKKTKLSFEFLPTNHKSLGQIQYRGIKKAGDGNMYCIPYYNDFVLGIDPSKQKTFFGPSVAHIPKSANRRWVDGVVDEKGRIICNCHLAHGHLIIDPNGEETTVDTIRRENGENISYGMQVRGGAIVNGIMYSTQYTSADVIRRADLSKDQYLSHIGYKLDRTGPLYKLRKNWERENVNNLYDSHWGAVNGQNGFVYGVPFGSDRVLILNTKTGKVVQGVDTLTGGHPIPADPQRISRVDPYLLKYNGGTLSDINKCFYSFGRKARTVLKFDTVTHRAKEIPLPEDVIKFAEENKLSIAFSSFEGPDGLIYSVPWQLRGIFWIDPRTDEVGYKDLSDVLNREKLETPMNFYTYGERDGDSVYLSPGSSNSVLKINFDYEK